MFAGGFALIVVIVALGGFVLWVVALIDALKRPTSQWEAAGQNQIVWVGVIVFANAIGALIYWLVARPQLEGVHNSI